MSLCFVATERSSTDDATAKFDNYDDVDDDDGDDFRLFVFPLFSPTHSQ